MYARLLFALIVLLVSPLLAQEIYKWEDENGVIHYGDIPAHPAAAPLQKDEVPYSHTGSLPATSSTEKKARLRQELDEIRMERRLRLPNAAPSLTKPKAWIERNGRLRLSGKIRNGGQGLCDAPTIEIVIFDDNGSEDGRFETLAAASTLARGEEAGFEGEYFTPVGDALSWDAAPRCGAGDGVVYGAHKRGALKIRHSRTIRLKRLRTR
ncbi:MAG TPA: DUF4124 domain-containing protein [Methylomirabilota bacterium]|jgi:hypothetical protein|nr:DUF4124 domain-containing protein [Methylomirabilota bacterium]